MVEGAVGAASGLQAEDYQGFSGASASQRSVRSNQMVDPNSREATLSRKNNLLLSGLVLATITGAHVCVCVCVMHAPHVSLVTVMFHVIQVHSSNILCIRYTRESAQQGYTNRARIEPSGCICCTQTKASVFSFQCFFSSKRK